MIWSAPLIFIGWYISYGNKKYFYEEISSEKKLEPVIWWSLRWWSAFWFFRSVRFLSISITVLPINPHSESGNSIIGLANYEKLFIRISFMLRWGIPSFMCSYASLLWLRFLFFLAVLLNKGINLTGFYRTLIYSRGYDARSHRSNLEVDSQLWIRFIECDHSEYSEDNRKLGFLIRIMFFYRYRRC